jgi:hypothetical protein
LVTRNSPDNSGTSGDKGYAELCNLIVQSHKDEESVLHTGMEKGIQFAPDKEKSITFAKNIIDE